jgi:thioredoxin 1
MMQTITSITELEKEIATHDVIVLDLYATWCKPCQEMLPVIEELSNTSAIPFYKVDIDVVPEVKEFTGAKAVPMLLIYKDGKRREFAFGITAKEKIQSKLNRVLRS